MALSQKLLSLKSPQLKHAAFLLGLPSTGTKADLEPAIRHRLLQPLSAPTSPTPRILSIDMGIKNLGICLLEPQTATPSTQNINIIAWQKLNVLQHLTSASPTPLFTSSALSQTALHLSTTLLQRHAPTHILIERQRFRSGGASAVQEWTLRVNMLEAMLWACWATMRATSSNVRAFPAMEEASPARVADFWCGGHQGTIVEGALFDGGWREEVADKGKEKGGGRKKVQKKEKIALVKNWLAEAETVQPSSLVKDGQVGLELVGDDALKVKEYFLSSRRLRGGQGGVSDEAEEEPVGKLDDLADCLLQGVAWIRWMENAQKMRGLLKDEIDVARPIEGN
ncbi:mitochondrial resolvase Ydc2 [Neohortaea acidophila]|uniref:Mitochondrial resolvase Ydc2 n=1 Tax=Neohortaea acidophila TaxID=245834 RepID=A0A6A6PJV3_9PEZI|nr:mitochondrial resolvase Ydc2 [Neohortaea acidophila]KAF2479981.1 mitochondrial resolvase Ydc2 [Neohortaea acidophila]